MSDKATELGRICRSALEATSPDFREATLVASFYPYIGLTHTLRRRKGGWILRISDHCRTAPPIVIEAIVALLAAKVLHRPADRRMVEIYDRFRREPEVVASVRERRRARGRKHLGGEQGRHRSLEAIFSELNARYFNSQLEVERIGWGLRAGRRRLGHYDPAHQTITISPVLDSDAVPRFVLEYVVYHEMLHVLFDDDVSGGRGRHHSSDFRMAERGFPMHRRAREYLVRLARAGRPVRQGRSGAKRFARSG